MKVYTSVLALALLISACNGQPSQGRTSAPRTAATSPSSSRSASPSGSTSGSFAVLVTPPTGATYTVSLVSPDGKVAASAQAGGLRALTCAGVAGASLPPPISTSDSRVYFMDAQGVVHFLTPRGETGSATTLPIGNARRSMFTVSPDDQRIAVIVSDFTATGASIKLYVNDLASGASHVVYSQTGADGLWPIGWHAGSLVVAKVRACLTGGSAGPIELHVIDPNTATRQFTIGGASCIIDGPPTPAGTPCEVARTLTVQVRDWTGVVLRTTPVNGTSAYVSPDGARLAFFTGTQTYMASADQAHQFLQMKVCGWVDGTHIIAGGDSQQQAMIGDVTTMAITPIAAQGTCAGRIPGGL